MAVAMRFKAGAVLALALAGLAMGAAAAMGAIPDAPPAAVAPAFAVVAYALMAVKVAALASPLLWGGGAARSAVSEGG
jgi:hypothetical protein